MVLVKIVYVSMIGNIEEIVDIVVDKLCDLGLDVEVEECMMVDVVDFEDVDIVIVVIYIYGDGDLLDEIVDFYEDLVEVDLFGKVYGVVGLGDIFYDYFCKFVDEFEV